MLKPLEKCNNPVHEFTIFGKVLCNWQIANDIWCYTQKNDNRHTVYLGFTKVEWETSDIVLYNITIWKLSIKLGFI